MDDNKSNPKENQPQVDTNQDKKNSISDRVTPVELSPTNEKPTPIFETISINHTSPETKRKNQAVNNIPAGEEVQPEEVSPDVSTPDEALGAAPPPPIQNLPPISHTNYLKFVILGGGLLFFVLIFFFLLKFILGLGATKQDITLQYWGLWEDKEIMEPLIQAYQVKNPHVKINYQKLVPQDYREKLISRSQKSQGPDIFRFHNTWLPEIQEIVTYIPSNVMTSSEFEKTFYKVHQKDLCPVVKNDTCVDHKYYGIPLMIDGLVLIYNDGLFKKAGIVKPPSTWEDITENVSKLSGKDKNGEIFSSPIAIGTASNVEHFAELFGLMLLQNGGDLTKLDQPESAGALESYRKLAEPPTDFWNDSMPNSIAAFIQEKVAMIIVPSWQILTIKAANPDLDMKVVGVPKLPGGQPLSISNYWVEGVSKYSKNQVEAWKFLKFLVEKENLTKLYEIQSKSRLFGEPYSRVDLASTLASNEYLGPVIEQGNYYVTLPLVSRTYDNGMNDSIVKYIENAITATTQGSSYSQALVEASKGVNQVLNQYKIEQ